MMNDDVDEDDNDTFCPFQLDSVRLLLWALCIMVCVCVYVCAGEGLAKRKCSNWIGSLRKDKGY